MHRVIIFAALLLTACSTPPPIPGALPALSATLPLYKAWTYADAVELERRGARQPLAASECCVYWIDGGGFVHAFDAARGRLLWRVDTMGLAASGVGIGSNVVYVGTRDGEVWALNAADGSTQWRARVSSEVIAAPTAAKDLVIVHAVDGKVLGLSASDGHLVWTFESKVPLLSLRGASTPVVENDRVIVGLANGQLVALKLWDGAELWQVELASARGRSELERMVDADPTPRVHKGVVYAAAFRGRVMAVDFNSGRALWSRDVSSSLGLALDEKNVYVTQSDGAVSALAQDNGTILWKQESLVGRGVTAPAAFQGRVVVGDRGGYLHWLNAESGQFVHRLYLENAAFEHGAIVSNDVLYVASRSGTLDAFKFPDDAVKAP